MSALLICMCSLCVLLFLNFSILSCIFVCRAGDIVDLYNICRDKSRSKATEWADQCFIYSKVLCCSPLDNCFFFFFYRNSIFSLRTPDWKWRGSGYGRCWMLEFKNFIRQWPMRSVASSSWSPFSPVAVPRPNLFHPRVYVKTGYLLL